ncbi:MAG TPA: hypothetical protein VGD08_15940 [Stellaceae bacterium]|jgi:hypothetical protein
MSPGTRLSVVLAAATAALAVLAAWPFLSEAGPVTPGGAPAAPGAAAGAALESRLALPPLDSFADIAARPLFSPTRRPGIAAPVAVAVRTPSLRLDGILAIGSRKTAILRDTAANRTVRAAEGDKLDGGWTVDRIERDRVRLVSPQGGEAILTQGKR